ATDLAKSTQRGKYAVAPIDLEELAQLGARVRAAEAVGTEHAIVAAARQIRAYLIREQPHVVRRCDDQTGRFLELLRDVGLARLIGRMKQVPALGVDPVAAQFGKACHAPDVAGHTQI